MEHKNIGSCKYCGSLIHWDEKYVRLYIAGDEPEQDIEEFGHLDCYLKEQIDFQGIVMDEKLAYWVEHP